ncbi:MAG TPA: hypothetical protein DCX53_06715 [Anaerolineae bacterium]|nr:hypothetical protein [Anaerolineae bacterium]
MLKNRLLNVLAGIALVVAIALTVREAAATAALASQNKFTVGACSSISSQVSIRTEYVRERKAWVTYTEDGPTGIDGGLIHLLSNRRSCSQ